MTYGTGVLNSSRYIDAASAQCGPAYADAPVERGAVYRQLASLNDLVAKTSTALGRLAEQLSKVTRAPDPLCESKASPAAPRSSIALAADLEDTTGDVNRILYQIEDLLNRVSV